MPMTLLEYAKGVTDVKQRAIIETFPEMVDFMGVLPYSSAPGGVVRYQEEAALADNVAFRAINELPAEGAGVLRDRVEQTFPLAGNIDVDRVLIDRHGPSHRTIKERMQIKQKAKVWADTFINGDNMTDPREFTGLKSRLRAVENSVDGSNYRSRILANTQGSGGGPLSLSQLDRAIGLVEGANAIIMPLAIKNRFAAAQRDTQVGGFITLDKDEMGRPVTRYNNLQIYTGYGITDFGEFLPFNEVAAGGGSAVTSSIYIVNFAEEGVCGIEVKPMEVTDMGLLENTVHYRTNIHHDQGLMMQGGFSAMRLTSITNAPIVK